MHPHKKIKDNETQTPSKNEGFIDRILNIFNIPQDWYRRSQTDLRFRYKSIFKVCIGIGITFFTLSIVIAFISSIFILILPTLIFSVLLPFILLILCLIFNPRIVFVDIPPEEVWYVERSRYFGRPLKTHFLIGTSQRYPRLRLNEIAYPFLPDATLRLANNDVLHLKDIMSKGGIEVSAKVGVIARFRPFDMDGKSRLDLDQVHKIVSDGPEKLYEILAAGLEFWTKQAINKCSYNIALQLPEPHQGNEINNDPQAQIPISLRAIVEYIIGKFGDYPDTQATALEIVAVDYQPYRPKELQKEILRHQGSIQGLQLAFAQASDPGAKLLYAQQELLRGLRGVRRQGSGAFQISSDVLRLFGEDAPTQGIEEPRASQPAFPQHAPSLENIQSAAALPAPEPPRVEPTPVPEIIELPIWKLGDSPVTLLCIEDEEYVYQYIAEILPYESDISYNLVVAPNKQTALQKLQDEVYHILLCDINLILSDPEDIGGIEVLKTLQKWGHVESYRAVIFSSQTQRINVIFEEFPNIVDSFLPKQQVQETGGQVLLDKLRISIVNTRINFGLKIGANSQDWTHFDEYLGWLADQIVIPEQVNPSSPSIRRLRKELELLLRRLYSVSYNQIYVNPLPIHDEYPQLAQVRPISKQDEDLRSEIIQVGYRVQIDAEIANFRQHIVQAGVVQSTVLEREERTAWLKGIVFTFPTPIDSLRNFKEFYKETRNVDIICQQIDILFNVFENWYMGETQRFSEGSLSEYYMKAFHISSSQNLACLSSATVKAISQPWRNFTLVNTDRWRIRMSAFPKKIRVHGNLCARNILLGAVNRDKGLATIHLLDFRKTGWGHPLFDFARFEMDLKLNCLGENVPLEDYYKLEDSLIYKEDNLNSQNKDLVKLYKVIHHLRTNAQRYLAGYRCESEELLCGLLFNCFDYTRYPSSSITQQRAAISSTLLMKKLNIEFQE